LMLTVSLNEDAARAGLLECPLWPERRRYGRDD
jgi:hypothetical protein